MTPLCWLLPRSKAVTPPPDTDLSLDYPCANPAAALLSGSPASSVSRFFPRAFQTRFRDAYKLQGASRTNPLAIGSLLCLSAYQKKHVFYISCPSDSPIVYEQQLDIASVGFSVLIHWHPRIVSQLTTANRTLSQLQRIKYPSIEATSPLFEFWHAPFCP